MSWEKVRLEDLCTKITDGTHKTPKYVETGVRFLSAKNVSQGYLNFSNCKYITEEEHAQLKKRCFPEAGDVMLSKSGSLGDSVVVPDIDFEFSMFESLALLKTKQSVIKSVFLQQVLSSPHSKKYFLSITTGLAVKHLHLVDLRKMPLFLPPLPEQTAIADQLSTWDTAIEKTEQLITAKEKQLRALYQIYFQPGTSANASWRLMKVSQFVRPRKEKSLPSKDTPLFSLTIEGGVTPKTNRYNRDFLVKDNGSKTYKVVHPGDIVFNPANLRWGAIA